MTARRAPERYDPAVELRVLGELEVDRDGEPVEVRGAKQRTILVALALARGAVVPTDTLMAWLWPRDPPSNPVNALQAQISALRQRLGDAVIVTTAQGYALDTGRVALDLVRFEEQVAAGLAHLAAGDAVTAEAVLGDALAAWRGPALVDVAYEELARADVGRLEELRLTATEARIEALLASGRPGEALGEIEPRCVEHPLRERLWEHRIVALYRAGRQADALRAFTEIRTILVEELGVEPGPGLQRLQEQVLHQDPALDGPAPSLRVPSAAGSDRPLPARLSRFVGREREKAELVGLVGPQRLVTVVGPGGSGKTRLAVEAAHELAGRHPGGAWFVELAPVTDDPGVAPAMAAALGVAASVAPGEPVPSSPVERIAGHLSGRAALLVVDNCEHVVRSTESLLGGFLERLPGLVVLATSREALGVDGEVLYPLRPLAPAEAAELFATRAAAVDPSFTLDAITEPDVAELCRRLDHLPLALELAAARLRALPLAQVVRRLDDRFRLLTGGARTALPRQQTLRAVVDWSHDLLFEDERRLFRRLSAFPAGCRLDAAEAVCADELLPREDVVDLLARLVDKSLLSVDRDPDGDARYRQLQTLLEYGRERLVASGEADRVRRRHAGWFRDLAVGAEEGLRGSTGPAWRTLVAAEVENLRTALDWLRDHDEGAAAQELATGVAWYWFLSGEWHEAVRWLDDALGVDGDGDVAGVARARALAWRAYFGAIVDGSGEAHVEAGGRALDELREHGTTLQAGEAGILLASTMVRFGRYDDALEVLARARADLVAVDHRWGLAVHDTLLCLVHARSGRVPEAAEAARRSVEGFESLGEHWAQIEPLGTIAALEVAQGQHRQARATYDRVIAATRSADLPGYLTYWLISRGVVAAVAGDDAAARADFEEAVALSRNPVNTVLALLGLARAQARGGEALAGRAAAEQALEVAGPLGHPDLDAAARSVLAACAAEAGDPDAVDLATAASAAPGAPGRLGQVLVARLAGDDAGREGALEAWAAEDRGGVPAGVDPLLVADRRHFGGDTDR